MSTRLIPDRRDRLATILVAPLMSCSARLPVYVLLTSMLFVGRPLYAGARVRRLLPARRGRGAGQRVRASAHAREGHGAADGAGAAVLQDAVAHATRCSRRKDQGFAFLKTAGTVIMAICIVMWWLSAYPKARRRAGGRGAAQRGRGAARPAAARRRCVAEADALEARAQQASSFAGRIGRIVAAGVRAARLRLAAHRRRPHQLPRARGVRLDDVGAARRHATIPTSPTPA